MAQKIIKSFSCQDGRLDVVTGKGEVILRIHKEKPIGTMEHSISMDEIENIMDALAIGFACIACKIVCNCKRCRTSRLTGKSLQIG